MKIILSIAAVLAGLVFIFVTHAGTDFILESLGIFTPATAGFHTTWMMVVALIYRTFFSIIGCYITALIAPGRPMLHALILGGIGVVLSTLGAIMAIYYQLTDLWYAFALIAVTMPCAWLGAKLASKK